MNGHIGWRLSLGLAIVPALMVTLGGHIHPDSPNSILDRGRTQEVRRILQKIRGIDNVGEEFQDLMEASEASKSADNPWKNIIERTNRPQINEIDVWWMQYKCTMQCNTINIILQFLIYWLKYIMLHSTVPTTKHKIDIYII